MGKGADSDAVPKKQLALSMALKQVEMAYGKGAVMQLGSKEVAKVLHVYATTPSNFRTRPLDTWLCVACTCFYVL